MTVIIAHVLGELSQYMDGRLPGAERRRLESHLEECESCRSHYEQLQHLRSQIPDSVTLRMQQSRAAWKRGFKLTAILCAVGIFGWMARHRRQAVPSTPPAPIAKRPLAPQPRPVETPALPTGQAGTPAAPKRASPPSEQALRDLAANAPTVEPPPTKPKAPPETAREWKGIHSAITEYRPVIVQNPEGWEKLWQEHTAGTVPPPPLPSVDFTKSMVVGIYNGNKPTAGYEVEMTEIQKESDQMVVMYKETSPLPGAVSAQILTQPFHLKVIPKTTLPIQFKAL